MHFLCIDGVVFVFKALMHAITNSGVMFLY